MWRLVSGVRSCRATLGFFALASVLSGFEICGDYYW